MNDCSVAGSSSLLATSVCQCPADQPGGDLYGLRVADGLRCTRRIFLGDRSVEARPAGAGIELGVRAEQWLAAARAPIFARRLGVPVGARERSLGALLAAHMVLRRGELLEPLPIALS